MKLREPHGAKLYVAREYSSSLQSGIVGNGTKCPASVVRPRNATSRLLEKHRALEDANQGVPAARKGW